MHSHNHKSDLGADKQSSSNHLAMTASGGMVADNHHNMIAKAAYYAAEKRGFAPGCALDDWLAAERGIAMSQSSKN